MGQIINGLIGWVSRWSKGEKLKSENWKVKTWNWRVKTEAWKLKKPAEVKTINKKQNKLQWEKQNQKNELSFQIQYLVR